MNPGSTTWETAWNNHLSSDFELFWIQDMGQENKIEEKWWHIVIRYRVQRKWFAHLTLAAGGAQVRDFNCHKWLPLSSSSSLSLSNINIWPQNINIWSQNSENWFQISIVIADHPQPYCWIEKTQNLALSSGFLCLAWKPKESFVCSSYHRKVN